MPRNGIRSGATIPKEPAEQGCMSERNPTRRQYLLAAGTSSVALLSGCSSGDDDGSGQDETQDATDAGDGSGQDETQNTTDISEGSGDSSGRFTPWVSQYGNPQKTRATPDPPPSDLESTTSYDGGGTVAVTDTGVFSLARNVNRVDPGTGETAFSRSAPAGQGLFVQNGLVVCGEQRGGNRVAALDAETGERAWLVEPGGTVVPFPAGDGIGYAGTHIGVLDPASGDTRWDRDRCLISSCGTLASYAFSTVAVHPESDTAFAYTGSDGSVGIEAFDLTNGERRWKVNISSQPVPVAVRDDTVYVSRRKNTTTDQVLALDRATGGQQWAVDRSLMGRNTAFAVDDDRIYIANGTTSPGTTDPTVAALDPASGNEQWSTPVSGATTSLLATGDALVRIGGRVELLSKSNGELQHSAEIDSAGVTGGNAVAGGRVYVTTVGTGGILVYGGE
jgi:outer membrane protein assembly factor BamB